MFHNMPCYTTISNITKRICTTFTHNPQHPPTFTNTPATIPSMKKHVPHKFKKNDSKHCKTDQTFKQTTFHPQKSPKLKQYSKQTSKFPKPFHNIWRKLFFNAINEDTSKLSSFPTCLLILLCQYNSCALQSICFHYDHRILSHMCEHVGRRTE